MSNSDEIYFGIIAVSSVVAIASFLMLVSRRYKKLVSLKLLALAVLLLPMVLLLLSVILSQISSQGVLEQGKGGFACSAYHGGGLSSGCSLYEAVFEGAIAAAIYSYATFGLVPLAVLLSTLSGLVLLKGRFKPTMYQRG